MQRRRRWLAVLPGGGTRGVTVTPYVPARASNTRRARSASAAIVSDGFTQSEVGTARAVGDEDAGMAAQLVAIVERRGRRVVADAADASGCAL